MRKVVLIGGISLLIILIGAIVIFWEIASEEKVKENQVVKSQNNSKVSESDIDMKSIEEYIQLFTKVIYNYDTNERNFYEGAEKYMTEKAYEILVPLPVSNEEPIRSMKSELQEVTCYYREIDPKEVEAIVEIWYTLSGTGEFRIRNLIKLQLIQAEGEWKINEFTVLETLEE